MTISEAFDEYIQSLGGDEYVRAWIRTKLAENPTLLDDLLTEKLKKEIQQDVKSSGKQGKKVPPKIGV